MKNKEEIKELLDYFQNTEDKPLRFDEGAIISAYQKDDGSQSLSIKILSVFGGILASLTFLGFLFTTGLHKSDAALLVFGSVFIAVSIWINIEYDKIIIDTMSVSFFIIGFILIGLSCWQLKIDKNIISISFIVIAFASLSIVRNYVLSFVSVLIINGSFLALIITNNNYDLIFIYGSLLTLLMTYFFLAEATIITSSKALSKLYNPVRIGLIFSFLSVLFFFGKSGILPLSPNLTWISSIVIISVVVYLVSKLFSVLNISKTQHKLSIYIFTVLALLPTALFPAISGAILILLLSFWVNYKTGFVLGIILFVYFISKYYYDLNFTLLTKSIILFSTGILFIALYLFTNKKLTTNEKI